MLSADETGRLRDVRDQVLADSVREGNAMGLVTFRLKGQSQPSIFIANDQVANLMLTPHADPSSPLGMRWDDTAVLCGLAYDGDGKAQACMGIAAGDVNQDGTIDLLVTNYYDESNTLYLQRSDGSFSDASGPSGLVLPSLKMLGFGAQFIDMDCDGRLELVVLNGHIDDMTHAGKPYRMRAQLFTLDNKLRFVEQPASAVGDYFAKERLGRALAVVDYNRDGRPDAIATHLDDPASLLRNDSQAENYVTINLVGTRSHRDAIGTEVEASIGNTKLIRQLIGGSGYMSSNQKQLHFGLGSAERIDRIEIRWPSGAIEVHHNILAGSDRLFVEGK